MDGMNQQQHQPWTVQVMVASFISAHRASFAWWIQLFFFFFFELRVSWNKRTCRLSMPCFGTAERASLIQTHQLRIIMRRGVAVTVQNCSMTFKLKEAISIWAMALVSMTSDSCRRCTRHVTRCWRFTLLVG
ncbi:hypothetical protein FOMG_13097 [Fusarium oxysporum f. sp. melonis 26406]|uniref:Uncharacterized protein n=1 Tax=Fusarium oxysporum f. sp. melonis 26406 TaxID=1089452 RepID=W9ZJ64_FUSOX|nr:hypothetical protein FOMG_13097 [Fusarium oxysporum f. sp. melonis 26406]